MTVAARSGKEPHVTVPENFTVVSTPMTTHLMTRLRDATTEEGTRYQELTAGIAIALFHEASRLLPSEHVVVTTPTGEQADGHLFLPNTRLVAIERAGYGLLDPLRACFRSDFQYSSIDIKRDEQTLKPNLRAINLPDRLDGETNILLDPMLATGGTANTALTVLKQRGARRIIFLCIVTAPDGLRAVAREHSDVLSFCVSHDGRLNAEGYILPGLGDMGNRLFGDGVHIVRDLN